MHHERPSCIADDSYAWTAGDIDCSSGMCSVQFSEKIRTNDDMLTSGSEIVKVMIGLLLLTTRYITRRSGSL